MTMLVASMDHSPQEIPKDRSSWHTTAFLVSESAEQWGWGQTLGPQLNLQGKALKKWAAKRNERYKVNFRRHFPELLAGSGVFALAFSVKGGTVVDVLPELIAQLGLVDHVMIGKEKVSIVGLRSGRSFTIPIDQASYVIYLLHFIWRMHRLVLDQLREDVASDHSFCDWQISPDNFPSGITGPMAELFSISANSAVGFGLVEGNLRVMTAVNGDPGADVCDNLAGMLRQDLQRGACDVALATRPSKGALYWEIHHPVGR